MYNDAVDDLRTEYSYFLAVANSSTTNKISIISIESTSLSGLSQTSTGSQVDYVAAHPTGNYLYVTDSGSKKILMYKVLDNGSLEVLGTGFITTAGIPGAIKVHPSGNYAYVANYGTSFDVSRYQIDNNGILSFQDSIVPSGSASSYRMAIDKTGTYLYVLTINIGSSVLDQFQISGSLNKVKYINYGGITPKDVVVHPNGQYVYVTSGGNINLYYNNGSLQPHGSISGDGIMIIHPSGDFLYTVDSSSTNSKTYQINSDGTLIDVNNSTSVGGDPRDLIVDPKGNYLIVSGRGSSSIEYLKINDNGTITPIQYYDGGSGHYPNALDGYRTDACGLALIRKKIN